MSFFKYRFGLFKLIQSKIDNLNEGKKQKIRLISYALVIIILMIIPFNGVNNIIQGLIFGLLLSFRDMCLKNTFYRKNTLK